MSVVLILFLLLASALPLFYAGYCLACWVAGWFRVSRFSGPDVLSDPGFVRQVCKTRVHVVIPAHNEQAVIAGTVQRWNATPGVTDVTIVADHCVDDTVSVAQDAGAQHVYLPYVAGKPAALREFFQFASLDVLRATPDYSSWYASGDLFLIIDADNLPDSDEFIFSMVCAYYRNAADGPVQSRIRSRGGNWLQDAIAVERSTGVHTVEVGRVHAGCTPFLGGTGVLTSVDGLRPDFWPVALCDDLHASLSYASDTVIAGRESPVYVEEAVIREQVPVSLRDLFRQRVRWAAGSLVEASSFEIGNLWQKGVDRELLAFFAAGFCANYAAAASWLAVVVLFLFRFVSSLVAFRSVGFALGMIEIFGVAGAVRSGRWRGLVLYPIVMLVNLVSVVVALFTWRRYDKSVWQVTPKKQEVWYAD